MTKINGAILIGKNEFQTTRKFNGFNPKENAEIAPPISCATADHVAQACDLAAKANFAYARLDIEKRAVFLETIADEIMALGDELVIRACQESGLPQARIEGERGRTTGQLRLFAQVVRKGYWHDAVIDSALPDRAPLPRPDLRRRNIPVGPVAVFGASNFPLAFSVAGGDTASALAAGCPVIVKGHSAHPGTGELVARAIQSAIVKCGLPEGVFSYLPGNDRALGSALVQNPIIKSVAFTGSRGGGMALVNLANARKEPIPVFAEMASINPVVLFENAAKKNAEKLGQDFIQSLGMGAGQFCTNPGLVIAIDGEATQRFIASARAAIENCAPQTMLTPGIYGAYMHGVNALNDNENAKILAQGQSSGEPNQCQAALFLTSADKFNSDHGLREEVFGSSSLIVIAKDESEVLSVLENLEGQLTATLLIEPEDEEMVGKLLPYLEQKVGRILVNGWPTGVEVCHAMVHGGPFPATSDVRTTSVGSHAIMRFLRPVCYQNFPDALLPEVLSRENPQKVPQLIDGER